MTSQKDVREIALSLPGAREEHGRFAFSVENKGKQKGFVWVWRERIKPRKPKVPNPEVIVIPVAGREEKRALLLSDDQKFFTEPHYHGYAAVLVRLKAVTKRELRKLITEAWRCQAPAQSPRVSSGGRSKRS